MNVNINQLQNQNILMSDKPSLPSDTMGGKDFREVCKQLLRKDIDLVVITNLKNDARNKDSFYSLLISDHQLKLTFNKKESKQVLQYDYSSDEFQFNSQKQPKNFENEFVLKLNQIGQDLLNNQASIYERAMQEG